jgi:hypothetical protein
LGCGAYNTIPIKQKLTLRIHEQCQLDVANSDLVNTRTQHALRTILEIKSANDVRKCTNPWNQELKSARQEPTQQCKRNCQGLEEVGVAGKEEEKGI